MPLSKTTSFSEYVRQLTEERVREGQPKSEVTPAVIHKEIKKGEKGDDNGQQFKVTVSDEMRNYWQAKLAEDPNDDTAKRIIHIADAKLALINQVEYEDDVIQRLNGETTKVFTLKSVNADGFEFDLPDGFEIRTLEELEAMPSGLRLNAMRTSFYAEVYEPQTDKDPLKTPNSPMVYISPLINLPQENKRDPMCLLIIHAFEQYYKGHNKQLSTALAFDYALTLIKNKKLPSTLEAVEITTRSEIKFESMTRPTDKTAFKKRVRIYLKQK